MARPALMKAEKRAYTDKKSGETRYTDNFYIRINGKPEAAVKPDGSKCYTEAEALAVLHAKLAEKHGAQAANAIASAGAKGELFYKDLRDRLFRYHEKEGSKSVRTLTSGEQTVQGITELDVFGGYKTKSEDGTYSLTGTKGRNVRTITEDTWFDEFIVRRYREGVSAAVISHSAKALRHMLRLANMEAVAKTIFVPNTDASREDCLYIEDFRRLIGQGGPAFIGKEFHPVLKFLFFQGVRVNETLNITWNQIDLEQGEFYPSALENKTGDTSAKALNPIEVIPMLRKLKGNAKDTDYVFVAVRSAGKNVVKRLEGAFRNAMLEMKPVSGMGRNKGPAGPAWRCAMCKAVNRTLPAPKDAQTAHACTNKASKICQQYRIPMIYVYCGPSLHSLRASCAVFYLESGMSETEVMKITGHTDVEILRGYLRMKNENIASKMGAASKRLAS